MRVLPVVVVGLVVVALWTHRQVEQDPSVASATCRGPVTAVTVVEQVGGAVYALASEEPSPERVASDTVGTMSVLGVWAGALAASMRGEARPESVTTFEARAVSIHQASVTACAPCPASGVQQAGIFTDDPASVTRAAAQAAGFTGADLDIAVAVAAAESGHRDVDNAGTNRDGTVDYGRWQINTVHADLLAAGDWRDPVDNARMAYAVWERAGGSWTPWVTFNSGAHLEHVGATVAVAGAACGVVQASNPVEAGGRTVDELVAFGRALEARGVRVTENAAMGDPPRPGSHSATGWHYKHNGSGAIDVNTRTGTSVQEQRELAVIAEEAMALGFGVIFMSEGHYGHLHVDVGDYRRVGDLTGLLAPDGSV